MGFPQIDSAVVGGGAVELNDMYFRRTSFPQIDSAAVSSGAVELDSTGREGDYIWLAPLASSSVCARTVTGSLLAGSPNRLVLFRLYSVVLSLRCIDDLDISRESPIPQKLHLGTTDRRIMPDICSFMRFMKYICFSSKRLCFSCVPSAEPSRHELWCLIDRQTWARRVLMLLQRRCRAFFGPSLDIYSEKLYDLAPDIPDVMGLRALRRSAVVVKVMSVPDSRCIQVVTPDDHVNIGFHEILLHDMGEEELPFVATSELDYLRRIGSRA